MEQVESFSERSFGILFGVILAAVGLKPVLHQGVVRLHWLVIGVLVLLAAKFQPRLLKTPHRRWLFCTRVLSRIMNPVIISLLFPCVVTPTSLRFQNFRGTLKSPPFGRDLREELFCCCLQS